ncbi:MAG TPA: hypothetical protein VGG25_11270 [Streptosporangiaceae bacterium]
MAAGKLAGKVLEVVARSRGLSEHGGDAEGERVAADAGEVLAEEISGSPGIAVGGGGDHFDVVALPVHRPVAGTLARCPGNGAEIGDREPEGRVGVDGEPQRRDGKARVGGALRLPVPRSGPPVCGYRAAMDVDRGPGIGQVVTVAGVLITRRLHDGKAAQVP